MLMIWSFWNSSELSSKLCWCIWQQVDLTSGEQLEICCAFMLLVNHTAYQIKLQQELHVLMNPVSDNGLKLRLFLHLPFLDCFFYHLILFWQSLRLLGKSLVMGLFISQGQNLNCRVTSWNVLMVYMCFVSILYRLIELNQVAIYNE